MILEEYKMLSLLRGKAGVMAGTACPTAGPCPMVMLHWPRRRWHKDCHRSLQQEPNQWAKEKHHHEGKGSIGRGAEPPASPSLLPAAVFQPPQMQGGARCHLQERENHIAQQL